MIYLYGLAAAQGCDLSAVLQENQGLQGPLKMAPLGAWTLIYSDHDDQDILPKRRLLLAHTRVLESLLPRCTALPARFGLVAQNLQQVTDLIESKSDEITKQFSKVQGAVEMGVRVSFPKQQALEAALQANPNLHAQKDALRKRGAEAHFEIAEFGGKLAEQVDRRRGVAQRELLAQILPLTRDHVLRAPEDDAEVLRAEFLLDQSTRDIFQAKMVEAAEKIDFAADAEPTIQIIGPAPMYHFVQLNLAFDQSLDAA